jgi:hypothetical protein
MSRKAYRTKMRDLHGPDWWKKATKEQKRSDLIYPSEEDAAQKKRLEALYKKQGSWGVRGEDLLRFDWPTGPDYGKYDLIYPGKITITREVMTYFGGNPNNLPIAFVSKQGNDYVRVSKTYKDGFTVQDLEDFTEWSEKRTGDHHHIFFEGFEKTKDRPLTYTLDMGS